MPDELRSRRLRMGLSQAQLARALRRRTNTVARWEQGARGIEAADVLRYILTRMDDDIRRERPSRDELGAWLDGWLDRGPIM